MADVMVELEEIFKDAEQFVERHYKFVDAKDRGIKILATMNQIIELKKMPPDLAKVIQELMPRRETSADRGTPDGINTS